MGNDVVDSKQYEGTTFLDNLQTVLRKTKESQEIKVRQIFTILAGRGYAALLIIFSFPFCIPIQIPGFSTPFGIILGFLGLRIAFARRLWWPKWILERKLNSQQVGKVVEQMIKAVEYCKNVFHPRLLLLTRNPLIHRLHGLVVFTLSILLSLPLPIPFTNMLTALPILFIGLGLLEEDGLVIVIGYLLAGVCLLAFIGLFLFGKAQIARGLPYL